MTSFVTGFIIFLISHSANIFFQNLKTILVKRVGLLLWKMIVSLLAILGFVLMVTHYQEAKSFSIALWSPTIPILYVSYILNFFAIWLLVSTYIPRNIIKLKLKHPMILGVKTWAFAHLLVNGDTLSIFVFGVTLVWAVFSFRTARKMVSTVTTSPEKKYSIQSSAATFFIGIMIWLYIIRAGHEYIAGIGLLNAT
ncbi:NnrU family protein [Betaproteobacteria bacterium]|nr:NnrU family protein [Betaproteobacteria bacterium]